MGLKTPGTGVTWCFVRSLTIVNSLMTFVNNLRQEVPKLVPVPPLTLGYGLSYFSGKTTGFTPRRELSHFAGAL